MAAFLRPDSNITQTEFTGGFAEIDEATASDSDLAYSTNNADATLEVGLSNPSGTPTSGTCTVRYRIAKTNNGSVDGGGNAVTVTAYAFEGSTQIAADSTRTADGTWTQYSFTFNTSAVSNWNDLRLRFVVSKSGGGPSARRGAGISWAELETPDPPTAVSASFTADAFIKGIVSGSFTANAYIKVTQYGTGGGAATTIIEDSFDSGGTDLESINGRTPDVTDNGNTWSTSLWIWRQVSGMATIPTSTFDALATIDALESDVDVSAGINMGANGNMAAVVFRYLDTNNYWWLQGYQGFDTASDNWSLRKMVSGSTTVVAEGPGDYIAANVRAVANGNAIDVYIDGSGSPQASVTDSALSSETVVGILGLSGVAVSPLVDNFLVKTVGGLNTTFTADAQISAAFGSTVTGSFTADAFVKKAGIGGSVTADAFIRKLDLAGSITADAYVQRVGQPGSFTADATISTTVVSSVTADAYIKRLGLSGSITADAYLKRTGLSGSFSANAYIATLGSGSFTADAFVRQTYGASLTADAHVSATVAGSFAADAYVQRLGLTGSFTADAVIANAVTGSFTADANISRLGIESSLTADAFIKRTDQPGSFVADAFIRRVGLNGSFTADAAILQTYSGSFSADAHLTGTVAGSITADAYLLATQSGSFTADAQIAAGGAGSFTADAYIRQTFESSITADSFIRQTYGGSLIADAYVQRTEGGSFTADAYIGGITGGSFTADAHIAVTGLTGSFTADAYLQRVGLTGSLTADAYVRRTFEQTVTADAFLLVQQAGSFTADASISAPGSTTQYGSFTADAHIAATVGSSLTADAYIKRLDLTGSVTADAFIRQTYAASVTADAHIARTASDSFVADAFIQRNFAASITADAYVQVSQSGSFVADAFLLRTFSGQITADAFVRATVASSFTLRAHINNPSATRNVTGKSSVSGLGGSSNISSFRHGSISGKASRTTVTSGISGTGSVSGGD